jgi:hypothetical protein
MGLSSLRLEISAFCGFLDYVLLLNAILGLDFLERALYYSGRRFDTATYHTAFPCTGAEPRRTAIIGWSVRRHGNGPPPEPTGPLAELDAAGLLDRPALRKVLGVPDKRSI